MHRDAIFKYFFIVADKPLQIKSVTVPENVKGYIYIEAYNLTHVQTAIENIADLKIGRAKQQLLPITEMPDILRVKKRADLKAKQYVRIKRGIYKDDIAQVDYSDPAQNQIYLKLLPRIDYTKPRGALRLTQNKSETLKRKRKPRPAAKPFDPEAIRAIGGKVINDGDFFIFERNKYCHKGYVYSLLFVHTNLFVHTKKLY
jgi:transcription elongation factor SPT5